MSHPEDPQWSYGHSARRTRSKSRSHSLSRRHASRSFSRNPKGRDGGQIYYNGNEQTQTHVLTFKPPRSKPKDTPSEAARKSKARQMIRSFLHKESSEGGVGGQLPQTPQSQQSLIYTNEQYRAPSMVRTPDTSMDMSDVRSVGSVTSRGSRASITSKGSKSSIVSIRKLKAGGSLRNPPSRPQRRGRSRHSRGISMSHSRSISRGRSVNSRRSSNSRGPMERVKSFRRSLSRVSQRSLSRVKSFGRSKSREPKWKREQRKEKKQNRPKWNQSKWTTFWSWIWNGGTTQQNPREKRIYVRATDNPESPLGPNPTPADSGELFNPLALCGALQLEPALCQDYLCACEDDESLIGRVIGEDDHSITMTTSSPDTNEEEEDDIRWNNERDGKEAMAPPASPQVKEGHRASGGAGGVTTPRATVKTLAPSPRDSPRFGGR